MVTLKQRDLIFDNWFGTLIARDINAVDIKSICLNYAKEYEMFISSLTYGAPEIQNNGRIIYCDGNDPCAAYGYFTAKPGYIYHWRMKVILSGDQEVNIGILNAKNHIIMDKIENNYYYDEDDKGPWNENDGWSYYSNTGTLWNGGKYKEYGDPYDDNDIIDMWLDLRDKYQISFAKNNKHFGKAANVPQNTQYKFGISVDCEEAKIEIISFEISS